MEFDDIRLNVILAIYTDDALYEELVVKGGNALRLVHGIGSRTSLDVDFSAPGEIDDDAKLRIEQALRRRFESQGFVLFDFRFTRRPLDPVNLRQSGYLAQFKIIERDKAAALSFAVERLRREAATTGPAQVRTFDVEISSYEYCRQFQEVAIGDFLVRAYSPEMIAIEKYRALCQQNAAYEFRSYKTPRARDFFDIRSIIEERNIVLSTLANEELFRRIFAAKDVPLALLGRIAEDREFHRTDWPSVIQSVQGKPLNLADFDDYFDFALSQIPVL